MTQLVLPPQKCIMMMMITMTMMMMVTPTTILLLFWNMSQSLNNGPHSVFASMYQETAVLVYSSETERKSHQRMRKKPENLFLMSSNRTELASTLALIQTQMNQSTVHLKHPVRSLTQSVVPLVQVQRAHMTASACSTSRLARTDTNQSNFTL